MAEEASDAALDVARRAEVEDREKRVDVALRAGRNVEAAQIALHNPPFGSKDAGLKDRNTVVVMKALTALGQKDADIHALLAALDTDLADNLMKYLYKGLEKPDNSGLLLKMHALLVEKWGTGCIVRAITDRKTA